MDPNQCVKYKWVQWVWTPRLTQETPWKSQSKIESYFIQNAKVNTHVCVWVYVFFSFWSATGFNYIFCITQVVKPTWPNDYLLYSLVSEHFSCIKTNFWLHNFIDGVKGTTTQTATCLWVMSRSLVEWKQHPPLSTLPPFQLIPPFISPPNRLLLESYCGNRMGMSHQISDF